MVLRVCYELDSRICTIVPLPGETVYINAVIAHGIVRGTEAEKHRNKTGTFKGNTKNAHIVQNNQSIFMTAWYAVANVNRIPNKFSSRIAHYVSIVLIVFRKVNPNG